MWNITCRVGQVGELFVEALFVGSGKVVIICKVWQGVALFVGSGKVEHYL